MGAKAKQMLEEGGDWDRRNRLKVYEGLYAMSVRDFSLAAKLFLDAISTFTSYELMEYVKFVEYTVWISVLALDRSNLHKDVIKGSEILEVLHQTPQVKQYLFSLYNCQYGEFFTALGKLEQIMKADRYLAPHYAYYVREMKVKAYAQLLESYRSLTLAYMADAFGVTEKYMDQELCRFIANGRLHAKIDKVGGIVITNRPDSKNAQYQQCIKQGDILLNRVQKLSRDQHLRIPFNNHSLQSVAVQIQFILCQKTYKGTGLEIGGMRYGVRPKIPFVCNEHF